MKDILLQKNRADIEYFSQIKRIIISSVKYRGNVFRIKSKNYQGYTIKNLSRLYNSIPKHVIILM